MELRTRASGEMWLLELEGNLTIGTGDLVLRKAIDESLQAGRKRLVLDLSGVLHIDSAGIGELVDGGRRAREEGGEVRLLNPSQRVREALVVSKLDQVFPIFTDQEKALDPGA